MAFLRALLSTLLGRGDVALANLRAPFIKLRKISPKGSTKMQIIHDALDKYVACMNEASSGVVGARRMVM